MGWFWLALAGICEIAWTSSLKSTDGFSRLWPSVFVVITGLMSLVFLAFATRTIPTSTAYVIWGAIGTVGLVLIGMIWQNESRDIARLVCIGFVIIGVIGLKWLTPSQ